LEAYINGIGITSPQKTVEQDGFLSNVVEYSSDYMKCVEPAFKNYLSPGFSRRMSRILKLSLVAAKICLNEVKIEKPDAIITATGLGCLDDTEKVLNSILENNESFLSPTSFIHSTHNTISSQIAIYLKCHSYNLTFSHRTFSFESAILNCMIFLTENSNVNVLIGGVDEITPTLFDIGCKSIYKKIPKSNLDMLKEKTRGAYAGEGMAFFILSSKKKNNCYAKISSVETIYNPDDVYSVELKIKNTIDRTGLTIGNIDAVMLGLNGDSESDCYYQAIMNSLFKDKILLYYKHLCGEYFTSTSFALWCCANIIKQQFVPPILKMNNNQDKPINNILIYNQFKNKNHSLILLQKC